MKVKLHAELIFIGFALRQVQGQVFEEGVILSQDIKKINIKYTFS